MSSTTITLIVSFIVIAVISVMGYYAWGIWQDLRQKKQNSPSIPQPSNAGTGILNPHAFGQSGKKTPPPQMELPIALLAPIGSVFNEGQFQETLHLLGAQKNGAYYYVADKDGQSPLIWIQQIPLLPHLNRLNTPPHPNDFAGLIFTLKLPVADPANVAVEHLLAVVQSLETQLKGRICSPESHVSLSTKDLDNYRRAGRDYVEMYRVWQSQP